jgi:hypothetical protein
MNAQFRYLMLLLGGAGVLLTYAFPFWYPYFVTLQFGGEVLSGLPSNLSERFLQLPYDQQNALIELADDEPELAVVLAIAQFNRPRVVPEAQQEAPNLLGPIETISGSFVAFSDFLGADGQILIYTLADSRQVLWIENLVSTNFPDIEVWLSAHRQPESIQDIQLNNLHLRLGDLYGNVGSQWYEIPSDVNLDQYNSIVLYNPSNDLIVSYASFFRLF